MFRNVLWSVVAALRSVLRDESLATAQRLAHANRHPSDMPNCPAHQLRRV